MAFTRDDARGSPGDAKLVETVRVRRQRGPQPVAAGSVLTMLADSMMPEAFSRGGRRIALLTALGFAVAVFLTTLD
jgi:hypothetical protein